MIAMLGMYDRPELTAANDAFWASIRDNLGYGPASLTRDMDFWDIWRAPDLLFAQTCGLPFRSKLHGNVQLVGTPDYGLTGCPAGLYQSVIVARSGSGIDLKNVSDVTLAYNEKLSQSGWAAFWSHVPKGTKLKAEVASGGHVHSAKMVATGDADIASIDALTWELIKTYDSFASDLRVIDKTTPTPGLPYITSLSQNAKDLADAVRSAIADLSAGQRELLHIQDLITIPEQDYLAIPLP